MLTQKEKYERLEKVYAELDLAEVHTSYSGEVILGEYVQIATYSGNDKVIAKPLLIDKRIASTQVSTVLHELKKRHPGKWFAFAGTFLDQEFIYGIDCEDKRFIEHCLNYKDGEVKELFVCSCGHKHQTTTIIDKEKIEDITRTYINTVLTQLSHSNYLSCKNKEL